MVDREADLSADERRTLERIEHAPSGMAIVMALSAARERLGMDVAYVTRVEPAVQTVSALMGDPSGLGIMTSTEFPIEQTYCRRMLDGKLPNVVPDTRREPETRDLAATENIGAYAGVPVTLADGTVHGTLCSASQEPRPALGEPEARFMRALAALVARQLDA